MIVQTLIFEDEEVSRNLNSMCATYTKIFHYKIAAVMSKFKFAGKIMGEILANFWFWFLKLKEWAVWTNKI